MTFTVHASKGDAVAITIRLQAVAAVAKGRYVLLTIGLAISIPIVIAGSAVVLALMNRFPILVWGGAGILGWVAGDIIAGDPFVMNYLPEAFDPDWFEVFVQVLGVLVVFASGYCWRRAHHVRLDEV